MSSVFNLSHVEKCLPNSCLARKSAVAESLVLNDKNSGETSGRPEHSNFGKNILCLHSSIVSFLFKFYFVSLIVVVYSFILVWFGLVFIFFFFSTA